MRRTIDLKCAQLASGLCGHRAVALHDPRRDLLIALPGCVLHHDAVLGLGGLFGRKPHAVIIVQLLYRDLRPFFRNVVKAGLGGALRHVHNSLLP